MLNGEIRELILMAHERGYTYKEIAGIIGNIEWGAVQMAGKKGLVRLPLVTSFEESGITRENFDIYFPAKKKVIHLTLKTMHHILNTYYLHHRRIPLDELIERYMDNKIDQTEFERTDWKLKKSILISTYSDVSMIVPAWYNLLDALTVKSERYGHSVRRLPKQEDVEKVTKPVSHAKLFYKFMTKEA